MRGKTPVKRNARRLLACLVLGVLSTIAVAWALSPSWGRRGVSSTGLTLWNAEGHGGAMINRFRWFGSVEISVSAGAVGVPEYGVTPGEVSDLVPWWAMSLVPGRSEWRKDGPYVQRRIEIRGWPMPAMWWALEAAPNPYGYWPLEAMNGLVISKTWQGPVREYPGDKPFVLPLLPAGLGFLVDAAFYGVLWTIPLLAIPAWRRARRRSRGLCPLCGYDLKGAGPGAPCPECGPVVTGA